MADPALGYDIPAMGEMGDSPAPSQGGQFNAALGDINTIRRDAASVAVVMLLGLGGVFVLHSLGFKATVAVGR